VGFWFGLGAGLGLALDVWEGEEGPAQKVWPMVGFMFEANVDFSMGRGECEEGESEEGWGFGARFLVVGCVVARDGRGEGAARGMRGTCMWARRMEGVCVFVHDLLSSIGKASFRVAEGVRQGHCKLKCVAESNSSKGKARL